MSRTVFTPHFEPPGYTADTVVEITTTGDVDAVAAAPQPQTGKLGALLAMHSNGARDTAFDPAKEDEFHEHVEVVNTVTNTLLGATSALEDTSLPYNHTKVEKASVTLVTHRQLLTETCPVAAKEVLWPKVETALDRLKKIQRRKEHLGRCLEDVECLEAHTLTFLSDTVTTTVKLAESTIENHRGLRHAFAPLTTLVRGAAEQGQETKRVVARALKRQGQKALTIVPVKDGAKDGTKDAAAPSKDKP